jgi:hypothetical protein
MRFGHVFVAWITSFRARCDLVQGELAPRPFQDLVQVPADIFGQRLHLMRAAHAHTKPVRISWPYGELQDLANFDADRLWLIARGGTLELSTRA